MGQRVKITGFVDLEDDEFDPGPLGPLTSEADANWRGFGDQPSPDLASLDELQVELA